MIMSSTTGAYQLIVDTNHSIEIQTRNAYYISETDISEIIIEKHNNETNSSLS